MPGYPYPDVVVCTLTELGEVPGLEGNTYTYHGRTLSPETGHLPDGDTVTVPANSQWGKLHPSRVKVYFYCIDGPPPDNPTDNPGGGGGSPVPDSGVGESESGGSGGGSGGNSAGSGTSSNDSSNSDSNDSNSNDPSNSSGSSTSPRSYSSLTSGSASSKAIFKVEKTFTSVVCVECPEQRLIFRQQIEGSCFVLLPLVFRSLCTDIIVTAIKACEVKKINQGLFYLETKKSQIVEFTGTLKGTISFRQTDAKEFKKQQEHHLQVSGCL